MRIIKRARKSCSKRKANSLLQSSLYSLLSTRLSQQKCSVPSSKWLLTSFFIVARGSTARWGYTKTSRLSATRETISSWWLRSHCLRSFFGVSIQLADSQKVSGSLPMVSASCGLSPTSSKTPKSGASMVSYTAGTACLRPSSGSSSSCIEKSSSSSSLSSWYSSERSSRYAAYATKPIGNGNSPSSNFLCGIDSIEATLHEVLPKQPGDPLSDNLSSFRLLRRLFHCQLRVLSEPRK